MPAVLDELPDGTVEAVPLPSQALKPIARARLAITVNAVFFILGSSNPPRRAGCDGRPMLTQ